MKKCMYKQGMYSSLLISRSGKEARCPNSWATLIALVASKMPAERSRPTNSNVA